MPKKPLDSDGRLIGYARVSTRDQSLGMQIDALKRAGVDSDNIHTDTVSGVSARRPGLERALKDCRPGDTLVVWRLDRFGRSLRDVLNRLEVMQRQGVGFKSLTEGIDLLTPIGRMLVAVLGSIAQFERDLIAERTKTGVRKAMADGKKIGAKRLLDDAVRVQFMRDAKQLSYPKLGAKYKIHPTSARNYLRRWSPKT